MTYRCFEAGRDLRPMSSGSARSVTESFPALVPIPQASPGRALVLVDSHIRVDGGGASEEDVHNTATPLPTPSCRDAGRHQ